MSTVKKKKRRPSITRSSSTVEIKKPSNSKLDIQGVERLVLSTITQKIVGCVMGENITSEDPWIYIKKEKIEDNIDLHDQSSEFLPIKDQVFSYPDEYILVGCDVTNTNIQEEEFFICTTIFAKDTVLNFLEEQKTEINQQIKNSLEKPSGKWKSLGSETVVDECIRRDLRPLYECCLEAKYPITTEQRKLTLRFVNDMNNGYIELIPNERTHFYNIKRQRIDTATQVTPTLKDTECQSDAKYPKHIFTQYHYEYEPAILDEKNYKIISHFLNDIQLSLDDYILINNYIKFHANDYMDITRKIYRYNKYNPRDQIYFKDVELCRNKGVAHLTYHPRKSGLIAAAYTRSPQNHIINAMPTIDMVDDTTFGNNSVLLWTHNESLMPKMYLQSIREVTYVSFCPRDPNIVIGGLQNGQIVIWDMTNRLEQIETREILTAQEIKHRTIISSLMNWQKNANSPEIVQPTVISNLEYSHTASVIHIHWLSSSCVVNRNGQVITNEANNEWTAQFLSCGMDSIIYIWDLDQKLRADIFKPKKVKINLPEGLIRDVSPLKEMHRLFMPTYKIIVIHPETKQITPISTIAIEKERLIYTPINSETLKDIFQRTYFTVTKSEQAHQQKTQFIIATITGCVMACEWEGMDFDQGQKINREFAKCHNYLRIHDAPIRTCRINPYMPQFVLTIGGRVFAIWDRKSTNDTPVFWRKSKCFYNSGFWSQNNPTIIVISRRDSNVEVWDILNQTKTAARSEHLSGNAALDIYSDGSKSHVRKYTFTTSDILGAIRVYEVPKGTLQLSMINNFHKTVERVYQRRIILEQIAEQWKKKNLKTIAPSIIVEETIPPEIKETVEDDKKKKPTETYEKVLQNIWTEKEEKYTYEILLAQKNINITELDENRKQLVEHYEENQAKQKKTEEIFKQKDKIFETAKNLIIKKTEIERRREFKLDLNDDLIPDIKNSYVQNYNNIENETLQYIKNIHYKYDFDWYTMIKKAKIRKNLIDMTEYNFKCKNALRRNAISTRTFKYDFSVKSKQNLE